MAMAFSVINRFLIFSPSREDAKDAGVFVYYCFDRIVIQWYMPWQVLAGTGVAVLLIVLLFAMISIRRVLMEEPAIVFRG